MPKRVRVYAAPRNLLSIQHIGVVYISPTDTRPQGMGRCRERGMDEVLTIVSGIF